MSTEALTYKLSAYEGPLDLLYQLIQANEIDICDIPVAQLADQYLEFIEKADKKDMESMSEFAYMAAALLELKSRMLLPRQEPEQEDPRKELVDKLLEYKRMKVAAEMFMSLEASDNEIFSKGPESELISSLKPPESIDDFLEGVSITMLYKVFKDVLNKRELKVDKIRSTFKSVVKDMFTVEDKTKYILELLEATDFLSFKTLIKECYHKLEMVVTFLAVLEMIKTKDIRAYQNSAFDDIEIRKC